MGIESIEISTLVGGHPNSLACKEIYISITDLASSIEQNIRLFKH